MTFDGTSSLSGEARAIVDAARSAEDPAPEEVARVRGRLFAHLGIVLSTGAATVAATTEAAGAVATASVTTACVTGASVTGASVTGAAMTGATGVGTLAKLTLATKLGVALLLAGSATTGVVIVTRSAATTSSTTAPHRADAPGAPWAAPPRADLDLARPVATHADATAGSEPTAQPNPSVAAAPPGAATAPPGAPAASSAAAPASVPASAPPAEPAVDPLAAETALLGRAQSALAAGRNEEALAILEEHARRFPRGALAHERDGARWLALCASGRAEAIRPALRAFLAESPASPLAARLRVACGLE